MQIIIDTSIIIAVILNEPNKERLIELTKGLSLVAPQSLNWEIGNALSALFKRKRIGLKDALKAVEQYKKIPIQFVEVSLEESVKIAYNLGIYAYDSYFLTCALKLKLPILTLDKNLGKNALDNNISIIEA